MVFDHRGCCSRQQFTTSTEIKNNSQSSAVSGEGKTHYAPHIVIQPIHMILYLDFTQIKSQTVIGKNIITFSHNLDTNYNLPNQKFLTTVSLDAISFTDLKVIGEGTRFYYDGKKISVVWDTPFLIDEKRKIEITYLVIEPIAGIYFNIPKSAYPNRAIHCITDHEPERCRHWIPCIDAPTVRTTLEFHITAPRELMAIANGRKTGVVENGDVTTTSWLLDEYPCPSYLICVAVGDFMIVEDGDVDGMPVAYLAPKGKQTEKTLKITFGKTKEMILWIQKKLDLKFPWSKYYQIVSPQIRGAMENISFVTWNDFYCCDEVLTKEKQLLVDQVNIHEIAHTYFGDLLVIRHFDHTWLKESWATYMEGVWIEEHLGEDDFRYELIDCKILYFSEAARYTRPIVKRNWESPWAMYDSHAYPGGALRIHMLRKRLGDDAFWCGVQTYLKKFKGKIVETEDFRKCLEDSSGLNLTLFFDQWIYGRGYPKFRIKYKYSFEKNQVQISLEQIQQQTNVNDGVPKVFDMDFDVEVKDCQGGIYHLILEFRDSAISSGLITLNNKKCSINTLRLDPKGKNLFSMENSDENPVPEKVLINTAKDSSDIWNRIWAFEELIKMGHSNGMRKVQEIIQNEPFWGVRVRVAKALAKASTQSCVFILATMLTNEKDPMAMSGIAAACSIRDENIREALMTFISRDDIPYKAAASAYENLGSQKNPKDLPFLINAANDPSKIGQHAITRSGIFEALANHSSKEGYEFLELQIRASLFRNLLKDDELHNEIQPEKALTALISAFASASQWMTHKSVQTHVIGLLIDLLRDYRREIRMEVIWAICELEVGSDHFNSIRSTKSTFPDQEWMFIEKKLKAVREKGGESKVKDLVKELEEVEGRLRKVEWNWIDKEDDKEIEIDENKPLIIASPQRQRRNSGGISGSIKGFL